MLLVAEEAERAAIVLSESVELQRVRDLIEEITACYIVELQYFMTSLEDEVASDLYR